MLKVKVLSVGKTKEKWLETAIGEYEKRLSSTAKIEWIFVKDDEKLLMTCEKEKDLICLDPKGTMYNSAELSYELMNQFTTSGSSIVFVIGGAEGIPSSILDRSKKKISLSALTFTHQITRLILVEQLYRSLEIQKGSHYHK